MWWPSGKDVGPLNLLAMVQFPKKVIIFSGFKNFLREFLRIVQDTVTEDKF